MSEAFFRLRNAILAARGNRERACEGFDWQPTPYFNWATDYFDRIATGNDQPALRVVDDTGSDETWSFSHLAARSHQVANFLQSHGVGPGDRTLVMLGNVASLWEIMLGLIRLGAVMIPSSTLLKREDLADRLDRGKVKAIVADVSLVGRFDGLAEAPLRFAVGGSRKGWIAFNDSLRAQISFVPQSPTKEDDLLLLYFTSGTTARPKLVAHSHISYPIGHLSTAFWIGLRPGDVHLNVSSPGWAKHAWSCFFAPWNAEATVLAYQYERFNARALLGQIVRCGVTSLCAPPTVWRMLIQEDLKRWNVSLREVVSAGEPLNPEVIERVNSAWGLTIRDGFGQTETTAMVGNAPGMLHKSGSMGLTMPGYHVALLRHDGSPGDEGELCIDLSRRPIGLMREYLEDRERTAQVMRGGFYHTGDIARRDAEGYLTYVGRTDDVFKSSDYRISPFELESVLIEHDAVAEAAVVPSPDALRLAVPKAFVVLAAGVPANESTARSIFEHVHRRVAPFKRIRRIEFADIPKTISGKMRRIELREAEQRRALAGVRGSLEYWESDFTDL